VVAQEAEIYRGGIIQKTLSQLGEMIAKGVHPLYAMPIKAAALLFHILFDFSPCESRQLR